MKKWLKIVTLASLAVIATVSFSACSKKQDSSSGKKVTIEYFNQKRKCQVL